MAEGEPRKDGLDIPIPWSATPLRVTGTLAIGIVIALAAGYYFDNKLETTNRERAREHDEMICNQNIEIFISQFPKGAVEWDNLPSTLYRCVPEYQRRLKGVTK